ncbi:hypothetical protein KP79_PYT21065 [Mizuhopecten yessoensis]|uniref:Uncharacterized protein n=1 Tax=Mizuhopecten yessoensis TaxID=6573 RepID=A0A210QA21_MIZYE|nr:hypothetical protein KP79_PYT21065 [Mizuhopecten yessoensis]
MEHNYNCVTLSIEDAQHRPNVNLSAFKVTPKKGESLLITLTIVCRQHHTEIRVLGLPTVVLLVKQEREAHAVDYRTFHWWHLISGTHWNNCLLSEEGLVRFQMSTTAEKVFVKCQRNVFIIQDRKNEFL